MRTKALSLTYCSYYSCCLFLILMLTAATTAVAGEGASVGGEAPGFSLVDQSGETVSLDKLEGKIRVIEWINPDCPFVERHYESGTMKGLAERFAEEVVWIGINSTHYMSATDNASFSKKHELPYPILDDHEGVVGKRYGAATTPHIFIVDADGILVYQGAIDDDPRGRKGEGATSYVAQVLEAMTQDKPLPVTETKPYGCSVKYKG